MAFDIAGVDVLWIGAPADAVRFAADALRGAALLLAFTSIAYSTIPPNA
jgi:hypothetical protein